MGKVAGTVVGLVLLLGVAGAVLLGRGSDGERPRGIECPQPPERTAPPPAETTLRGAPAAPAGDYVESASVESGPKIPEEKAEPAFPVPESLRADKDVRGVAEAVFQATSRVDRLYGDDQRVRLVALEVRGRRVKGELEAETPALLDAALQVVRDEFEVPATEYWQVDLPDHGGRRAASFEFRTNESSAPESWEPTQLQSLSALQDAIRSSDASLRAVGAERREARGIVSRVCEVAVPDANGLLRVMTSLGALRGVRITGLRWSTDASGKLKAVLDVTARLRPEELANDR